MYFIIVAEDDPGDLFLLQEAINAQKIPYGISSVKNGPELLHLVEDVCTKANRPNPDLIILDWTLPKSDASEMLQEMRNSELCANTPILVLTSSSFSETRVQAFQSGATCFIQKPTDLDEYLKIGEIIQNLLQNGSHQELVCQYSKSSE